MPLTYYYYCTWLIGCSLSILSVLFPGGGLWFNTTLGYAEAGRYIYDIARELNEAGDYFPIWGE